MPKDTLPLFNPKLNRIPGTTLQDRLNRNPMVLPHEPIFRLAIVVTAGVVPISISSFSLLSLFPGCAAYESTLDDVFDRFLVAGSMLTRRRIFVGGVASVICAPAIVRAESLMPIRALIVPMQPVHAGFVERLRFHCMERLLKNGWTTERARTFGSISENEARRQVTYARMHGLLASCTDPA